MVLGVITSVAACPAIVGTTEAIQNSQRQQRKQQHRQRKTNLVVGCQDPSQAGDDLDGSYIVLRDNKVMFLFRSSHVSSFLMSPNTVELGGKTSSNETVSGNSSGSRHDRHPKTSRAADARGSRATASQDTTSSIRYTNGATRARGSCRPSWTTRPC